MISNYLLHHLCSFLCMEQIGSQWTTVVKCYIKDFHSNVSIQHKFGSNQTKKPGRSIYIHVTGLYNGDWRQTVFCEI